MFDKVISAIFLPGLLVILFSRVTYNRIIGLALTVALIAASAYKGYTHTLPLIVVDAASLTLGFYYAEKILKRDA
ncbi:CsbA family protein [Falsibacillus pallidus]|uniref:General stress protein CsbA n=1 Tax=Falsibacillus pallidus TaxID=493781 RepID=A0A370GGE2_9BACI|nr:CsbA family protein [Falsibacillus pallidus]RDI41033.1 general stress protein CsbA [Falsibacillus pallidus]